MKTKNVIVIVTKSGKTYTIGSEKSVQEVLNEINACKSDFFTFIDTCAIKVSEIASIEKFAVPIVEEGEGDD